MREARCPAIVVRSESDAPAVHVAGGDTPYANTRSVLTAFDVSGVNGARVLLKPNAGRVAAPGSGITTHPRVVAAVIDVLVEAGATVVVGDSPITGVDAVEALETSGIAEVARGRGCELLDLDAREPVDVDVPTGAAVKRIKVCADVLESDLVVSMPVVKMHMHTGVTLAVKNMKGCLWRRSKVELHMIPQVAGDANRTLDIAIADMAAVLRPGFAVIDGTVGMEGLGPSAGEPRELGVVVASVDAFAADAVACRLIGMRAEDVPHLQIGAARGYGIIDLGRLHVFPSDWEQWRQDFAPAPRNLSITFPNVTVLDRNSCSACQSTVLLFLKRYGKDVFDYWPADTPVNIAIGKGHEDLPAGTLCIGNCTARHQDKGLFVAGCPPVASSILKALKDRRSL